MLEEARLAEEARLRAEAEARAVAEATAVAAETARLQAEASARRETGAAAQQSVPAPVAPQAAIPAPPADGGAFGLRMPVNAPISSGFGWRATPPDTFDFNGTGGYLHTGVDFAAACGTPLHAPAAGEVWYADSDALLGAGKRIVLNHGVVGGNVLATNFYHLSRFNVAPGQRVTAGQVIGYVGDTGNSAGCHLHFETMLNGNLVDPRGLL
ncbi:murein DD-endopeptidase MepM/ murein hydrolase activator NlpD [Arthrobacter sp. CAN_A214]|uniref:M23 family metallopeptidase n=1 Tax=Arthrobacter sp. CAN_A214 TaxID=2787720 RepID=UPI0018CA7A88